MAVEHALAGAAFPVGITGHFSDDVEAESVRLEKAISTADVVIISGAVSMGKLDWIPSALDGIGRRIFHGVAQRPGKPMGFWLTDDGTRIFALPGNPVSTLVATYRYIIPFLRARQGLRPGEARKVTLAHPIDFTKPMTAFIPVCLESGSEATPLPLNNSADYARLAGTDGFVELPPDSESFPTGTKLIFTPWKS
jgi:molybdopterin molybdotransferase